MAVFELFSSYTMTMNVISVRLMEARANSAEADINDVWHPILDDTGMYSVHAKHFVLVLCKC